MDYRYIILDSNGTKINAFYSEIDAVIAAEEYSRKIPGSVYYIAKVFQYVEAKPISKVELIWNKLE